MQGDSRIVHYIVLVPNPKGWAQMNKSSIKGSYTALLEFEDELREIWLNFSPSTYMIVIQIQGDYASMPSYTNHILCKLCKCECLQYLAWHTKKLKVVPKDVKHMWRRLTQRRHPHCILTWRHADKGHPTNLSPSTYMKVTYMARRVFECSPRWSIVYTNEVHTNEEASRQSREGGPKLIVQGSKIIWKAWL